MADVIGPIIAIVLVFVVYYVAQNLDVSGESKIEKLKHENITAETEREKVALERRKVEVEMGRLAIEAKKLELEFNPNGSTDATEAEFEVVDELEDKSRKK